jgi:hypothetical protein
MTAEQLRAAGLRVRALEWAKSRMRGWNDDWHTEPSGYIVRYADEEGWFWKGPGASGFRPSPDAAKAAAQADYEARILAALEQDEPR